MKNIKLVVIGGGSSYTPELVDGIIKKRDSLPVKEILLVDIEQGLNKVKINCDLIKRMLKKANLAIEVDYSLNRKQALHKADFVVTQIRVGGLAARAKDECIPLNYGAVGQETTGAGGFAKALRTIPVMLDICRDMEEMCPDAWLINFTNPAGIVTEAVLKHTKIKCIGLCNVPINMHYDVAERLKVEPKDVACRFIGLNHLSFLDSAKVDGEEKLDIVLNAIMDHKNLVQNINKLNEMKEYSKILKLLPSPYLQYFFLQDKMIEEEQEDMDSGKGSRAEQVMEVERKLFHIYKDKNVDEKPEELSKRGGSRYSEAAISLIHSIFNNTGDIHVVNVMNNGAVIDLPDDVVAEMNCIIDKDGAHSLHYGHLPLSVKGLIQHVKGYEQLTIEAAITGDKQKALLALASNPLIKDINQAGNILSDLLQVHQPYLPQFDTKE